MKRMKLLLFLVIAVSLLVVCKSGSETEPTVPAEVTTEQVLETMNTAGETADPREPKDDELLDFYEDFGSEKQQSTIPSGLHGSQSGASVPSSSENENSSVTDTAPQETNNPWGNGENSTKDDEL